MTLHKLIILMFILIMVMDRIMLALHCTCPHSDSLIADKLLKLVHKNGL